MIFRGTKRPKEGSAPDPDETLAPDAPANAFEAAWPFNADSPQVEGIVRPDRFLSIMLVDVTGLEWDAIAAYLDTVRDTAKAREMVPVLIVDLVDFRGLIDAGLAYDTLPNMAANAALDETLDWAAYLSWRRHLLTEKWHPAAIINLSNNPDWEAP